MFCVSIDCRRRLFIALSSDCTDTLLFFDQYVDFILSSSAVRDIQNFIFSCAIRDKNLFDDDSTARELVERDRRAGGRWQGSTGATALRETAEAATALRATEKTPTNVRETGKYTYRSIALAGTLSSVAIANSIRQDNDDDDDATTMSSSTRQQCMRYRHPARRQLSTDDHLVGLVDNPRVVLPAGGRQTHISKVY